MRLAYYVSDTGLPVMSSQPMANQRGLNKEIPRPWKPAYQKKVFGNKMKRSIGDCPSHIKYQKCYNCQMWVPNSVHARMRSKIYE